MSATRSRPIAFVAWCRTITVVLLVSATMGAARAAADTRRGDNAQAVASRRAAEAQSTLVPHNSTVGSWVQMTPLAMHSNPRLALMSDGRLFLGSTYDPTLPPSESPPPEIFDPATNLWTAAPPPPDPTTGPVPDSSLVALANDDVLLGGPGLTPIYDLFDPSTSTWSVVSLPSVGSPLLLRDGRVLFWGRPGSQASGLTIWNPTTNGLQYIVNDTVSGADPLMYQAADGRVVFLQSRRESANELVAGTGSYYWIDPQDLTMTLASTTLGTVACSGGAVLPDGEVLHVGEENYGPYPHLPYFTATATRFDPLHIAAVAVASLPTAMTVSRSVVRVGDKVLVVAGVGAGIGNAQYHNATLLFDPAANCWTTVTQWPGSIVADTAVLADGSVVAVDWTGTVYRLVLPGLTTPVPASTYVPLPPTRLLDTRFGNGLSKPFISSVARTFQVSGRGGVPSNAVAITGNLTVTGRRALAMSRSVRWRRTPRAVRPSTSRKVTTAPMA